MKNKGKESLPTDPNGSLDSEELWLPSRLETNSNSLNEDEIKNKKLMNNVRSIMNKLTPSKFYVLVSQFENLQIDHEEIFDDVVDLIIEAAVNDLIRCTWYVYFVASVDDKRDNRRSFKTSFVEKLMNLFEDLPKLCVLEEKEEEMESCRDPTKKSELFTLIEECKYLSKKKALAICQILGELFKLDLFSTNDLTRCIDQLLSHQPVDLNLECLHKLLVTIGARINNLMKKESIDKYFAIIGELYERKSEPLSSRIRFFLCELIEWRRRQWIPRDKFSTWQNFQLTFEDTIKESNLKGNYPLAFQYYDSVSLNEIEKLVKILRKFIVHKTPVNAIIFFTEVNPNEKIRSVCGLFLCVLLRSESAEYCGRLIKILVQSRKIDKRTVNMGFSQIVRIYKNYQCFAELKPRTELVNILRILVIEDVVDLKLIFCKPSYKFAKKCEKIFLKSESQSATKSNEFGSPVESTVKRERKIRIFNLENQSKDKILTESKQNCFEVFANQEQMTTSLIQVTSNIILKPVLDRIKIAASVSDVEELVDYIINRVIENPCFCPWYVELIVVMKDTVVFCPRTGRGIQFSFVIITKCQELVSKINHEDIVKKQNEIDACLDLEKKFDLKMKLANYMDSVQKKLYSCCEFIFELLSKQIVSESKRVSTILQLCSNKLIEIESDDAIIHLCKFYRILGSAAKTMTVVEIMLCTLWNLQQKSSSMLNKLTIDTRKLLDDCIIFLEHCMDLVTSQKSHQTALEYSEIIFIEHFYLNDVPACVYTLIKYFDREEMADVIKTIFKNVAVINYHPSVVEFCAKLIIFLLTDERIFFAEFTDAVLSLYKENDECCVSNLPNILTPVIKDQPELFIKLKTAFNETFSNKKIKFLDLIDVGNFSESFCNH